MAMTACYPNYDLTGTSQGVSQIAHQTHQSHHVSAIQQQNSRLSSSNSVAAVGPLSSSTAGQQQQQQTQKDYSIPLHVDCSVEYELPNQAKPPVGGRIEPLLMIHPCYFRKMESQRRSPFINNMPNPVRNSTSSTISNLPVSSSTSSNSSTSSLSSTVLAASRRNTNNPSTNNNTNSNNSNSSSLSKSNNNSHMLSAGAASVVHQNQSHNSNIHQQSHNNHSHIQQATQQPNHPNLQQQIDHYVQRQMVHMSQQAQYPMPQQQQPSQQQYMQNNSQSQAHMNSNWERYMNVSNGTSTDMLSRLASVNKPNIPNQSTYKKSSKRSLNVLSATCANSYSNSVLEGGLPSNGARWDIEKASMAAIPRDYQAGPESIPQQQQMSHLNHHQQAHKNMSSSAAVAAAPIYRNPNNNQNLVGKRDAMLSGGCSIYSNSSSNSNPSTDISSLSAGLWDQTEKSPMATIPSNYQAGPDSIPNNLNSNSNCKKQRIEMENNNHTQQHTQQQIHHQHITNNNNNSNLISGKYKEYLRSHRIHPYMMGAASVSAQSYSAASQYPRLNGAAFPQIQQVSCYNV